MSSFPTNKKTYLNFILPALLLSRCDGTFGVEDVAPAVADEVHAPDAGAWFVTESLPFGHDASETLPFEAGEDGLPVHVAQALMDEQQGDHDPVQPMEAPVSQDASPSDPVSGKVGMDKCMENLRNLEKIEKAQKASVRVSTEAHTHFFDPEDSLDDMGTCSKDKGKTQKIDRDSVGEARVCSEIFFCVIQWVKDILDNRVGLSSQHFLRFVTDRSNH